MERRLSGINLASVTGNNLQRLDGAVNVVGCPSRLLIHGGEQPYMHQHVRSILEYLQHRDDVEFAYVRPVKDQPINHPNPRIERLADITWKYLRRAPNLFQPSEYIWTWRAAGMSGIDQSPPSEWRFRCSPLRGYLPWKPDMVLNAYPMAGNMLHRFVPWAGRKRIPIVSIDHGAPLQSYHWGGYRGSMWGCKANACWGEWSRAINIGYGAPADQQVVTGSPTLDDICGLSDDSTFLSECGLDPSRRKILLMTTHTEPLKGDMDVMMRRLFETYEEDERVQLIVKPHPVELRKGTLIDIPDHVHVIPDQPNLHKLMHAADCIISPATSVIIPALAMNKPFVNLLQPDRDLYGDVDLSALNDQLGEAVIHPDRVDAAILGEIEMDQTTTGQVFEVLGHSADGRNGQRVLDLCAHILEHGGPQGWVFST